MAGAADRQRSLAAAGAVLRRRDWRARALRWRPTRIALVLSAATLATHAALWGEAAPLGAAPLAGALLAAAGVAWVVWAWALFRAAGTPTGPTDTPLHLIEEGPYRLGRHPMYLGLTALMLGAALGVGAPLLGAAALAFATLMHTVHVPHEEAQMAQRFGGWWRDYAVVTRRWL